MWNCCQQIRFICWFWPRMLTGISKSTWMQMNSLEWWCVISACWENCFRKHKQGWCWKLISLAACTISKWELQLCLSPGFTWSAIAIQLNRSQQILIAETLNGQFAAQFASPKPSVPMHSDGTPLLTGQFPMFLTSLGWNEVMRIMAKSIHPHHYSIQKPTRIWSMWLTPFSTVSELWPTLYIMRLSGLVVANWNGNHWPIWKQAADNNCDIYIKNQVP